MMKPYGRKTRPHGRATAAQYQAPYYPPQPQLDYSAQPAPVYPSPYPPLPPTAAYYAPPTQPPFYSFTPADKRTVEEMVRRQIEYYFSDENLIKDIFLRNKMDKDGFVQLSEIASFQRVVSLTQDMDIILNALKDSELVEICDGIKIRPKREPLRWPLSLQPQQAPQTQQQQQLSPPQQLDEFQQPQLQLQHQQHQPQQQQQQLQQQTMAQQPIMAQQPQMVKPQLAQPTVAQQPLAMAPLPLQQQQQAADDQSPLLPLHSQQQQQLDQKPQSNTHPGTPDASSPNKSNASDTSSVANNLDSNKSFTYATAVGIKQPTTNGHNNHQQPHRPTSQPKQNSNANNNKQQSQKQNSNQQPQSQQTQQQQQQQPIGDIPINSKHNKTSNAVESEWKEVKSRRRRSGKA